MSLYRGTNWSSRARPNHFGRESSQLEDWLEGLIHHLEVRDAGEAEWYFDEAIRAGIVSKNRGSFHRLIHMCAKKQAAVAGVWTIAQMVRLGIPPTITTFNALIDACAKAENVKLATNLWSLLLELELSPTCVTYNTMLNVFAQVHDVEQTEIWMKRLLKSHITPCVVSYSTVISAFAKVGEIAKAEEWFGILQDSGVIADRKIFNSMINACAKGENPEKAEFWFVVMEKSGITPDKRTYNSLIHASAKVGSIQDATRWLNEMECEGLQPDQVTLSSVIHACAKAGKAAEADMWMRKLMSMGVTPNDVCYNAVLHACASAGDEERASWWMRSMSQHGVPPNQITFNCMIDACAKTGAMSQCQVWLESMIEAGFHPDERTCMTLSNAGARGTERERMWAFESIILAYAKWGHVEPVQHWLSNMISDGLVPTDAVQKRLLQLCHGKAEASPQKIKRKLRTERNWRTNGGSDRNALDLRANASSPNAYGSEDTFFDTAECVKKSQHLHQVLNNSHALAAILASNPQALRLLSALGSTSSSHKDGCFGAPVECSRGPPTPLPQDTFNIIPHPSEPCPQSQVDVVSLVEVINSLIDSAANQANR